MVLILVAEPAAGRPSTYVIRITPSLTGSASVFVTAGIQSNPGHIGVTAVYKTRSDIGSFTEPPTTEM